MNQFVDLKTVQGEFQVHFLWTVSQFSLPTTKIKSHRNLGNTGSWPIGDQIIFTNISFHLHGVLAIFLFRYELAKKRFCRKVWQPKSPQKGAGFVHFMKSSNKNKYYIKEFFLYNEKILLLISIRMYHTPTFLIYSLNNKIKRLFCLRNKERINPFYCLIIFPLSQPFINTFFNEENDLRTIT